MVVVVRTLVATTPSETMCGWEQNYGCSALEAGMATWGKTFYEIFVSCSIGNNLSYKQPNLTPSEIHRLKINPNRLSVGVHSIGFEVLRQHARKISISYMSTVGLNE